MSVPSNQAIQDLLTMLLGHEVQVTAAKSELKFLRHPSGVAVYLDDADEICAVCACDLELANYAGAALAMLPVANAAKATEQRNVDPSLAENTHEVMNIMASLYPEAGGEHVRLSEVVWSPPLPKKLAPLLRKPRVRVDLDVRVKGYEGGGMILFMR